MCVEAFPVSGIHLAIIKPSQSSSKYPTAVHSSSKNPTAPPPSIYHLKIPLAIAPPLASSTAISSSSSRRSFVLLKSFPSPGLHAHESTPLSVFTPQYLFIIFSLTGARSTMMTGNAGAAGVNVMAKIPAVRTIWTMVYQCSPA